MTAFLLGLSALGCETGGMGDPCVPEDEYQKTFAGYSLEQTAMEGRSFQCETRLCLVNHFQGRVSCPYGQSLADDPNPKCHVPGTTQLVGAITVDVRPSDSLRLASEAVYCSCRCAGKNPDARYCQCPDGFSCEEIQKDIGLGGAELAGSYCVKNGTSYDWRTYTPGEPCDRSKSNCGSQGVE
jgi:hypothetical protein